MNKGDTDSGLVSAIVRTDQWSFYKSQNNIIVAIFYFLKFILIEKI